MPTLQDVQTWRGCELRGTDGEKIGKVEEIYLDRETGEPEWLAVKTGLFGSKHSFVPIEGATMQGEAVTVPYDKDKVKDAPNIDADGELSAEEEARLYEHYGRQYREYGGTEGTEGFMGTDRGERFDRDTSASGTAGMTGTGDAPGTVGRDVSGPTTDDAMTRSEEELDVGTARRERGRARLRKYVVTENVETSVPVQREEVRVEREPITDENVDRAMSGPEISEEEHEVVLHEEEPVVGKRAVPKERVRMEKDTVTEERGVSEEVRKERIEAEGTDETGR
ncbi:MAG TPA: PRC and DUF2382 domain-containing protein [Capillimicrobium sp.]|nr:PRC and DUF2382 domain-containing protein [Capillimicrobium sp.]